MTIDRLVRDLLATMPGQDAYLPLIRCVTRAADELFTFGANKVKSHIGEVKDNMTLNLPADCMKIFKVAKVFFINGEPRCYPLGREKNSLLVDISKPINCVQYTDTAIDTSIAFDFGTNFYYYPHYYGEFYGYNQTRFFGLYDHDEASNKLHLFTNFCVSAGDQVAVTYKSTENGYSIFPSEAVSFLQQRALMYFWENADPNKSVLFEKRSKDSYKRYKRYKLDMPYEEWVDAITSGYSNAPR
jgi:hypothetical protein